MAHKFRFALLLIICSIAAVVLALQILVGVDTGTILFNQAVYLALAIVVIVLDGGIVLRHKKPDATL